MNYCPECGHDLRDEDDDDFDPGAYRRAQEARKKWDALPIREKYRQSVEFLIKRQQLADARGPIIQPQRIDPDRPVA